MSEWDLLSAKRPQKANSGEVRIKKNSISTTNFNKMIYLYIHVVSTSPPWSITWYRTSREIKKFVITRVCYPADT